MPVLAMTEALGLPLGGADDIGQPIAALVVVKYFDDEAENGVAYRALATDGLTSVEAIGMARYATVRLERAIGD